MNLWLVVSTHLENICQMGNLPQIGVKIKNVSNHQLDLMFFDSEKFYFGVREPFTNLSNQEPSNFRVVAVSI